MPQLVHVDSPGAFAISTLVSARMGGLPFPARWISILFLGLVLLKFFRVFCPGAFALTRLISPGSPLLLADAFSTWLLQIKILGNWMFAFICAGSAILWCPLSSLATWALAGLLLGPCLDHLADLGLGTSIGLALSRGFDSLPPLAALGT